MLVLKACGEGFMRSTAEASVFTRRDGSLNHFSFDYQAWSAPHRYV